MLSCLFAAEAFAYRPFDGTDAAVADLREVEIELGPIQFLREGTDRTLAAPALIFNIGIFQGWEAVLEGRRERSLGQEGRSSLVDNGAFLKGVLREGSLQDKSGPSVATEFGALLPDVHGDPGTGASLGLIVSQQGRGLTVHGNFVAALNRAHHGDLFVGTIFEVPLDFPLRPVAEVYYERDTAGAWTASGLVGAIWRWSDTLSFDVGVRRARAGRTNVDEIRAGLTWGFALWR